MKNTLLLLLALSVQLVTFNGAFAQPEKIECATLPEYLDAKCDVCYTDSREVSGTASTWTTTIKEVEIPWTHGGGELKEIIYDNEQKFPEIRSGLTVKTTPTEPSDLWTNPESLIWSPYADYKDYILKKDETIGLYTLAKDGSITVSAKAGATPSLLIFTPLIYRDIDVETNEESLSKTRNICMEERFTLTEGNTASSQTPPIATDPVETPDKPEPSPSDDTGSIDAPEIPLSADAPKVTEKPTTLETPKFNSAGETPASTITKDQTKTETGPAIWVILAITFALSGGIHAWRKQKAQ